MATSRAVEQQAYNLDEVLSLLEDGFFDEDDEIRREIDALETQVTILLF